MSRLKNILKNLDLLKKIKLAMLEFGNEFNVTPNQYFADKLHFKNLSASVQFSNLFQPHNEKYLKLDEFLIILDNLSSHRKIILDYLCNKYDYVCTPKAYNQTLNTENIRDLLLNISSKQGYLFQNYLNYASDNMLDSQEIEILLQNSYQARATITEFENNLKSLKKEFINE
jgi:hypothetical protein